MEIVLARHGRPVFPWKVRRQLVTFREWTAVNRSSPLQSGARPDAALGKLVARVSVVAASDLPRAHQSAQRIAPHADILVSPLFREADLSERIGGNVRLPGLVWEFFVRGLWRLGVTPALRSRRETLARAREATSLLEDLAARQGSVALIGHGVMNRIIARCLRRQGWVGPHRVARTYWAGVRFHKRAPRAREVIPRAGP